jgi:drug/metabolite transporter (DMT)-like permease
MSLDLGVAALVLLAALMHAGWNTAVKTGADRLLTFALVALSAGLTSLLILPFVAAPAPAAWPFMLASVALHGGYKFFLLQAYRVGDLSHVYPLARGTAPLIVAALSGAVAGERLAGWELAGVVTISVGVISIALGRGRPSRRDIAPVLFAVGTGVFIASYTMVDGMGVRQAGSRLGYITWLHFLDAFPITLAALYFRGRAAPAALRAEWKRGVAGGLFNLGAYGLVIWALSLGAMAPVAALRETGVIFAAVIGTVFLSESFGLRRVVAACIIASGIVLLGVSHLPSRSAALRPAVHPLPPPGAPAREQGGGHDCPLLRAPCRMGSASGSWAAAKSG